MPPLPVPPHVELLPICSTSASPRRRGLWSCPQPESPLCALLDVHDRAILVGLLAMFSQLAASTLRTTAAALALQRVSQDGHARGMARAPRGGAGRSQQHPRVVAARLRCAATPE